MEEFSLRGSLNFCCRCHCRVFERRARLCVFLMSKKCWRTATEHYLLTQTFLLCHQLPLSWRSQGRGDPHLAESATLLCAEEAKSTRRAKKKRKQRARLEERRSILAISVHSCFSSKWGRSITLLMSAAAFAPQEAKKRFECSPLEELGSKLLFTRRLSNPSSRSVNEPSRGFLSNAVYYVKSGRGY